MLDNSAGNSIQVTVTPFDMIGMFGGNEAIHPGRLIFSSFDSPDEECEILGDDVFREMDVVKVRHRRTERSGIVISTTTYFAKELNFLPVLLEYSYSNPKFPVTRSVVTDIKQCEGSKWFPMRVIKTVFEGDRVKLKDVYELRVTELSVTEKPSEDDLQVQIPSGAWIHDNVNPNSQTRLPSERLIRNASDVATLRTILDDVIVRADQQDVTPAQLRTSSYRVPLIALNVLVVVNRT